MSSYIIHTDDDGVIRISGKRLEQFTVMTDFGNEGGIQRFRDVLRKIGLDKAIKRERGDSTADVYIGDIRVTDHI